MRSYITPYADQNITQEEANLRLPLDKVVVGWYSNRRVRKSVVHSHPYHEYLYAVGGKATYHVNGSRYELNPGEFLLIPAGVVHTGYYDTYDRLIIQIDDAFWREALAAAGGAGAACRIPQQLLIFHAEAAYKWGVRALLEKAAVAAGMENAAEKELMYRSLLVELALIIRQIIREDGLGQPAATSPLVATVAAYIQEHYRDPELNVAQLAREAYVSREHLSRVFKEYTMQSVSNYLAEIRMQSCRSDIAEGKSILAACTENGFSNYSSFLKMFRKRYGVTPAEYRTRLRNALRADAAPTRTNG